MRTIKRMLLLWLIMLPVSYVWGIPAMMHYIGAKTKAQTLAQCAQQLQEQQLPLNAAQGDTYCHCIADPLIFTREDLVDVIQRQPPRQMTAQLKLQVDTCNAAMQDDIMRNTPQQIIIN